MNLRETLTSRHIGAEAEVERETRFFLGSFDVVPLQDDITERAVQLWREYRVKLPDAVIWASADIHSMLLVTRNTKDFPPETPCARVPYAL